MEENKKNELMTMTNKELMGLVMKNGNIVDALESQSFSFLISNIMYGSNSGREGEVKKYISSVMQVIRNNKDLRSCEIKSVILSMLTSANLGLPVDAKHMAYLVPRRDNKNGGVLNCTFQIGYQAYLYWAQQDPEIDNIQPFVVYDCDEFEYWSDDLGNHYKFKPNYEKKDINSKPKYGVAVLRYKQHVGRQPQIVVMTYADIEKVMPKFGGKLTNFWREHPEEMIKKTVVRKLGKWFIKGTDLERLNQIDNSEFDNEFVYYDEDGNLIKQKNEPQKSMLNINELESTISLE